MLPLLFLCFAVFPGLNAISVPSPSALADFFGVSQDCRVCFRQDPTLLDATERAGNCTSFTIPDLCRRPVMAFNCELLDRNCFSNHCQPLLDGPHLNIGSHPCPDPEGIEKHYYEFCRAQGVSIDDMSRMNHRVS